MITRKQFIKFCNNHNIKFDEMSSFSSHFVPYMDAKDPSLDKSLVNPADTFIYVSFTSKEYAETEYLYKPLEKLYDSTKPDKYGCYGYTSYGYIRIKRPIHCYIEDELRWLFSTKNFTQKDVTDSTIPFNTLDQLEHLYNKFNQFAKDVKDFYYSESFQQAAKIYKNNKELIIANDDLVKKTLQIIKRKHDLSEDFIK